MTTPTIEERVAQLEDTSRTHEAMLNLLISIGERQQALLERHQEAQERQQETQERHQALQERQQETLDRQEELLAEVRRDAQQTQRLWVRLAQRYGWLDENDDTDQR